MTIYDENLKLVKRIDSISDEGFSPIGIALNLDEEKFFITDNDNHRILMTDFEFNLIKSIGSAGTDICQFDGPYDLCLAISNLYVSDYYNKHVYSKGLEFLKLLKLDYSPWKVNASNSMLFIYSNCGIYFYYLDDLQFFQRLDHTICRIYEINSN